MIAKQRVGIDTKWYFDGHPSGRIVIRNWVSELYKIADKTNFVFFFFFNKKFESANELIETEQIKFIWVKSFNNLITNTLILPFYANRHQLDLVLYHNFTGLWGNQLKIQFIHDVIYETHPQYFSFLERFYFSFIRYTAKFSDIIYTISESEKNRIINSGYRSKTGIIRIVKNGVSESFFADYSSELKNQVRLKHDLPENFILYVGRINVRKNITSLLEAFNQLNIQNLHLVLVGKPDWKTPDLNTYLTTDAEKKNMHLLGFVDDAELPVIYSLATIFCFPSLEEGFGIPPIEAMASGVPVITCDRPVFKEICGEFSSYFNDADPSSLGMTIEGLVNNYPSAETLVSAKKQASVFSWKNSIETLINHLKLDLLNS